jgi:hypothetical protein
VEADLIDWLLGGTAITALVSTRVNWNERPQAEALPAVTCATVAGGPIYLSTGLPAALRNTLVQIDCWAASATAAVALREAVESRMGAINLNNAAAPLEGSFLQRTGDSLEPEQLGGGGRVFRQSMDFAVWRRA